jgi:mandelate racemase
MIAETKLTISGLQARAVNVELERPVQTSAGEITSAALVLIDLETREGTTGRAYIRSYTTIVLEPLRRLVENFGTAGDRAQAAGHVQAARTAGPHRHRGLV